MPIDAARLARRTVAFAPTRFVRVMKIDYRDSPLGTGHGPSRFSSPTRAYTVLYAGLDLATAIAECVIRDRFEATSRREIDATELDGWCAAEISVAADLKLADLRGDSAFLIGLDTDTVRARDHRAGQTASQELHDRFDLDGILYRSRLTDRDCMAVFDRAILPRLIVSSAVILPQIASLGTALDELQIALV